MDKNSKNFDTKDTTGKLFSIILIKKQAKNHMSENQKPLS